MLEVDSYFLMESIDLILLVSCIEILVGKGAPVKTWNILLCQLVASRMILEVYYEWIIWRNKWEKTIIVILYIVIC